MKVLENELIWKEKPRCTGACSSARKAARFYQILSGRSVV